MFKKLGSFTLVCLLMHTTAAIGFAGTAAEKESRRIEKIKGGIARLGIGKEARITVKLIDKTKLSGYLAKVNNDSFIVSDLKTGVST
jgi:hypothetical protein